MPQVKKSKRNSQITSKKLDDITIVNWKLFNLEWITEIGIEKRRRGNQGHKNKRDYKSIVTAFDIETTRIEKIKQSIMYVWQWAFDSNLVVVGRTWEEFNEFQNALIEKLGDSWLVVFVHNLSYEFSYLSGIYNFSAEEVMPMSPHKILKCDMKNHFEFRCSYIHSNMSLDKFTERMNVKHKKLSGEEFDYSKKRYPWTPLSDDELRYCVNDVVGLVEAIKIELEKEGDTLETIPLTSTGYVRREAKNAFRNGLPHYYVKNMLPDLETYVLLRRCFRGGNTHANRFFVGDILENCKSVDRASSYPDVLCNHLFPVSAFYKEEEAELEDVIRWITKKNRAVIADYAFYNLRLKDELWGAPYLTIDKARNLQNDFVYDCDNGRILRAEYLENSLTDIDLLIILDEYDFDFVQVKNVYWAKYGKLPVCFRDLIKSYYRQKTELKGDESQDYFYRRSKEKLNSLYGMCAMNAKSDLVFVDGEYLEKEEDFEKILAQYNKRAFLPYQWGVYCTAWARWELEEAIKAVNRSKNAFFVYCDTDSVKYIGNADFSELNTRLSRNSIEEGITATDSKGREHPSGVWEFDGAYEKFVTLGAKKYAYTTKEGEEEKLSVTISGVNKLKGGEELADIKNFRKGFVFTRAGGTEIRYNYKPEITEYKIGNRKLNITSNAYISDSTYTLGITDRFEKMLENTTDIRKYLKEIREEY